MAQLKHMVNGIYQIVKSGGTDVYSEYEKIPVMEHGDIYAVASVAEIYLENVVVGENDKFFRERYLLDVKILGRPYTSPMSLYEMLDVRILDKLTSSGYVINSAKISAPVQDNGLKRLILECRVELLGKTEVVYESQS